VLFLPPTNAAPTCFFSSFTIYIIIIIIIIIAIVIIMSRDRPG
jgi:hypothetical protein